MKQPNSTKFKHNNRWLGGKYNPIDPITKKESKTTVPNYSPGKIITSADGKSQYEVTNSGALRKV